MSCWADTVTLHGSGNLVLGGHYPDDSLNNAGNGGKFINTAGHTIRGGGQIQALGVNQGQVIADNGNLYIQSGMDNTGGTMSASGAGNVLLLYGGADVTGGQINPQDGKVTLAGSNLGAALFGPGLVEIVQGWWSWHVNFQNSLTLSSGTTLNIAAGNGSQADANNVTFGPDNGDATLVNNGAIFMNGHFCYLGGYVHLTLQGTGSLTMQGDADNYLTCYDITLQSPQILQGFGQAQCKIINNSTVIASNGPLSLSGILGAGTVSVTDGATLNLLGDAFPVYAAQMGDLTMSRLAALTVNKNIHVELQKNLSFAQTDPASWNWGTNSVLRLKGQGPWQSLEVGGRDYGASNTGLTNNFALPELDIIGAGTQAQLVDLIDNGHRAGGHEALYVTNLLVDPGTTLNLNGLKLYAMLDGNMHRVRAGEGSLFGGGKIIDHLGEGTLFLLLLDD